MSIIGRGAKSFGRYKKLSDMWKDNVYISKICECDFEVCIGANLRGDSNVGCVGSLESNQSQLMVHNSG